IGRGHEHGDRDLIVSIISSSIVSAVIATGSNAAGEAGGQYEPVHGAPPNLARSAVKSLSSKVVVAPASVMFISESYSGRSMVGSGGGVPGARGVSVRRLARLARSRKSITPFLSKSPLPIAPLAPSERG